MAYFREKFGDRLQGGANYGTMEIKSYSEDDMSPEDMPPRSPKNKLKRGKQFGKDEPYFQLY